MTLDLERWYHVAVSWDESVVNVYVNGVLAGSEEAVGTPIARADTSIGKRCTANIQDVRVYPVAMSADGCGPNTRLLSTWVFLHRGLDFLRQLHPDRRRGDCGRAGQGRTGAVALGCL